MGRHPDFLRFWTGQTISMFGSQITFLALPLTAIHVLGASPAQMGLLSAVEALPALLIGLLVGVWVDRHRRRRLLIVANIGRAAVLLLIPALALLNLLRMEYVYIIALLIGTLGLFFGVASQAFLVSLVGKQQLVEANSKLELSRSAAEIAGPGVGGVLIQLLTAPAAIAFDALSFIISALFIGWIKAAEPEPASTGERQPIARDIIAGLRLVADDTVLRALALCLVTVNLFNSLLEAVWLLYVTRDLGIEAGLLGLIFGGGSVGFLVGAVAASRIAGWIGTGPALIAGIIITAAGDMMILLAGGSVLTITILLIMGGVLFGVGLMMFNIGQVSLRQMLTPDPLLGRLNATMQTLSAAAIPVGALLGGTLGEVLGLHTTLAIAVVGELASVIWLLWSPVRTLREVQPTEEISG